MKKPTVKSVTAEFEKYRLAAKNFIWKLQNPTRRRLMSIVAADAQGRINGITIPELLVLVQLTEGTNERVYLSAQDKTLTATAEAYPAARPTELY